MFACFFFLFSFLTLVRPSVCVCSWPSATCAHGDWWNVSRTGATIKGRKDERIKGRRARRAISLHLVLACSLARARGRAPADVRSYDVSLGRASVDCLPSRCAPAYKYGPISVGSFIRQFAVVEFRHRTCLAEAKEARDSAKEAPSVTERSFATTSRASRSRPFVVWLVVAVSSVSRD